MAITKKTSTKKTEPKLEEKEVVKQDDTLSEELEEQKKQNSEMTELMLQMKKELEELKKEKLEKEAKVVESIKNEDEDENFIPDIPSNKKVRLTHMVFGGTTLFGTKRNLRLSDFGDIKYCKYEDLEDYRYDERCRKIFENQFVYIDDKDVRKALGLEEFYKIETGKQNFIKIAKSSPEDITKFLKNVNTGLQCSFATFFIDGIKDKKQEFLDINKWDALNKHFNINIAEMIQE